MCPNQAKPPSLQWYGYAVDGLGFHCLELPEAEDATSVVNPSLSATVIAHENKLIVAALT